LECYEENALTAAQSLEIRNRYNIPHEAFVVCFCGRLGKEKGIDDLIDLWKYNINITKDMYLMIIGNGPYREVLEEQANKAELGDRVVFTGAIMHDQLPPYYAASNAYATASLSDTYSISMLEAQASGLPVIQRFDPENIDQIKVGVNGWLFHSAVEFGEILMSLHAMTVEDQKVLQQTVRESIKERSSINIANYLMDLYQTAIERKKSGQRIPIHETAD
jgi:1,2-diacylglycerol 3-alpha-glucosyltransferase